MLLLFKTQLGTLFIVADSILLIVMVVLLLPLSYRWRQLSLPRVTQVVRSNARVQILLCLTPEPECVLPLLVILWLHLRPLSKMQVPLLHLQILCSVSLRWGPRNLHFKQSVQVVLMQGLPEPQFKSHCPMLSRASIKLISFQSLVFLPPLWAGLAIASIPPFLSLTPSTRWMQTQAYLSRSQFFGFWGWKVRPPRKDSRLSAPLLSSPLFSSLPFPS